MTALSELLADTPREAEALQAAAAAFPEAPLLQIEALSLTRDGAARPLLDQISLAVAPGETVVLLGESGCGKEALVQLLAGAVGNARPTGRIAFAGQALRAAEGPAGRRGLAYLPGPAAHPLSPHRHALGQLVHILARRLAIPQAGARTEFEQALGRLDGAPDAAALDALPAQLAPPVLAYGLTALALAQAPTLIVADQPLAGLAPVARRRLAAALKAEQQRLGAALLYSAMATEMAASLGGRILVLRHGRIVEEGSFARLSGAQAHAYTRTLFRDWQGGAIAPPRHGGRGEPVLQISGLELAHGATKEGGSETLNFELRRGAALALLGEAGSGRHRLMRQIGGLERPRSGRIAFDAVDIGILSAPMLMRLRRRIAYVTGDDDALDPRMTVHDTVAEPLRAHLGLKRDILAGYREAALKRVGLASLPGQTAVASLSRFDKRRLQVARAIVTAPLLAILDEPLAGLDAFAQSVMRDLLRTFRAEEGPAILLVTADFATARALAEAALIFREGRIVERGSLAEMMAAPRDSTTRSLIAAAECPAPAGVS